MSKTNRSSAGIWHMILRVLFGLFLCLISMGVAEIQAVVEAGFHLVAGWIFFLGRNLPALRADPDVGIPGVIAFLISIVVIHALLRGPAARRGLQWRLGNSIALAVFLPLLFAISFLVPGVLLQGKQLSQEQWIAERNFSPQWRASFTVHNFEYAVRAFADKKGTFPEGLGDVWEQPALLQDELFISIFDGKPAEAPIYLGTGFTAFSEASLPLLISAPFPTDPGLSRVVVTIGGEHLEIRDEHVDLWIQRSLDARPSNTR